MREIKFRGKTLEDRGMMPAGSWVEGGYYVDYCYGGCPEGKHYIVTWNSTGLGFVDLIQVDPETIGQYTGLNYQNDNQEVYEDDLCGDEDVLYRVIWQNGQFALKVIKTLNVLARGLTFPIVHYLEGDKLIYKKVGTAWEHPHLLKGDEKA